MSTVTFQNMGESFLNSIFIFMTDSAANRISITTGHAADLLQEGNRLFLKNQPAERVLKQVVNLFGGVLAVFMAEELVPIRCAARADSSGYNAEILDGVDIVFF